MRELHRDPDTYKSILRRRLLRAAFSAVGRLDRVSRGRGEFDDELQLRACIALTRLAPALVGEMQEPHSRFDEPEWWTPEKVQMLELLDIDRGELQPQEWAAYWLQCFRLNGPLDGAFASNAEAQEYGRQRCLAALEKHPPRTRDDDQDFENRILNQGE